VREKVAWKIAWKIARVMERRIREALECAGMDVRWGVVRKAKQSGGQQFSTENHAQKTKMTQGKAKEKSRAQSKG
jgi:hypothetical protein